MSLMPRCPIESGLGSPALPLCAFLRARTSAVLRGSGKSLSLVCFAKLKSFPARMGAKCVSVSPLQAIGLVESLLANIWLICGSVHPPLFASTSVFLIAIVSIYFAKYCPFSVFLIFFPALGCINCRFRKRCFSRVRLCTVF